MGGDWVEGGKSKEEGVKRKEYEVIDVFIVILIILVVLDALDASLFEFFLICNLERRSGLRLYCFFGLATERTHEPCVPIFKPCD